MCDPFAQIVERILASAKYRWLCPASVARTVDWARQRGSRPAEVERRARRKLHQIHSAYLHQRDAAKASRLVARLLQAEDAGRQAICGDIAALHASTRERMAIVDGFYEHVLADAPPGATVLDIGCGFNAFCLPWIRRISDVRYVGWEIDRRMVELISDASLSLGGGVQAHLRDAMLDPPQERFDMIWLLKMLPCLMQQDPDGLRALWERLPAGRLVVSFPLRSLGGRNKGMLRNYSRMMEDLLLDRDRLRRIELPGELLYLIDRV